MVAEIIRENNFFFLLLFATYRTIPNISIIDNENSNVFKRLEIIKEKE